MLVFCRDPLDSRQPDSAFAAEITAARELGLGWVLIDHDRLDHDKDAKAAVGRLQPTASGAVYRGWMIDAEDYHALYDTLFVLGIRLINDPHQYVACHHAPLAYPHVARWSALTTWVEKDGCSVDALKAALAPFGDRPVVLKDWVTSSPA